MITLHKTVAPVLLESPSSCWLWAGKSHAGKPPHDKEHLSMNQWKFRSSQCYSCKTLNAANNLCKWKRLHPQWKRQMWPQPKIPNDTHSFQDCETLSRGPSWNVSKLLTHINWGITHKGCVKLLNRSPALAGRFFTTSTKYLLVNILQWFSNSSYASISTPLNYFSYLNNFSKMQISSWHCPI